uniref:Uncharacterized protein n=1 Tax=Sinocyclocheilus anshuiensis TaxID=1608454 RepID=A0A671NIR1_9TELE
KKTHLKNIFQNHEYKVCSCDQNLNRCCELVELTSKIQGQLFTILNLTAQEGNKWICTSLYFQYLNTVFSVSFTSSMSHVHSL